MDRKIWVDKTQSAPRVALRKESVDRKKTQVRKFLDQCKSLSARRAWIEKFWGSDSLSANASLSARRAWIEKLYTLTRCASHRLSLSARRAWIEKMINQKKINPVALRKESVDRKLAN